MPDVVDALRLFSQPELIETETGQVSLQDVKGAAETATFVAPLSRNI